MSNSEEKENLKNENMSSDEEDKTNAQDKNIENADAINKLFKSKENEGEDKIKVDTNEVNDILLIQEKIKTIRNMKFSSDDLLKNKKYEEAIDKYKETINLLLEEVNKLNIEMTAKTLNKIKEEIIIPCYQNIALCYMKLNKWLKVKTYTKKVLDLNKDNLKARYRVCLANIKLGHLKKADSQLEELETLLGGSPELEELEKIYEINKLNSEGNNGEFLRKMGRKLRNGKINMYSDKEKKIQIEKVNDDKNKTGFFGRVKNYFYYLLSCCKKKKKE